jgi:sortase (surface protein transpeptidase)
VILGFHHGIDEISTFLGYYAVQSHNSVPKFQDNLSVPSSRVRKSKKIFLDFMTLEEGDGITSLHLKH